MKKAYLGIDPGISGALCIMWGDGTIDAYKPNCAGGSYKVQVGDYVLMLKDRVLDTISDWVKITKIVEIPGEYETYNLGNQDYGTIIVDDIVTHNS